MRQRFHTAQWVDFPREQVFAFFADPANLPPLMPKWQRARLEGVQYLAQPELSGGVGRGVTHYDQFSAGSVGSAATRVGRFHRRVSLE